MPEPIKSRLTPEYRYNPAANRYIAPNGRFVPRSAIRAGLDDTLKAAQSNIDDLSRALINNEITLAQWQAGMSAEIKNAHLAASALERGGWAQMTQSDYGAVGGKLKRQYQYLRNFAEEIASGKQKLNGNLLRRARMYVDAARGTGQDTARRVAAGNGLTEEIRILGKAEHCPDCLTYAGWGWRPIGTLPPIGASVCRTNCHCHFEYR
jgi:hypothetical protein